MNKRLTIYITAIFALFALVLCAIEISGEYNYKKAILSSRLEAYANIISRSEDFSDAKTLLPDNIRASVISQEGNVLFDSYGQAQAMDNHLSRPEIAACLNGNEGCAIRKSETAGINYIYFARKYGDIIVRTALPFQLDEKRFLHPDWMLLFCIGLLFLVSILAIRQLSLRAAAGFEKDSNLKLSKQKKRMTANISHELRTPVTSIRGYLETILNKPTLPAEKSLQFTERAYSQTLRLSELIRDISLINKIEEAPELLNKEYIGVRKITEELAEEFAQAFSENGIKFNNNIPEELSIKANASLIYAIFRNLIENSIKYADTDSLVITIEGYQKEGKSYFQYSDNGKGVDPKYLDKIFERFYRIKEEGLHHSEGSGLGLSIVKNAVLFHSGTIKAENLSPTGLRFSIVLN